MKMFIKKTVNRFLQPGCLLLIALLFAGTVFAGEIRVTRVQYPKSPETVTIGEKVPIVVTVEYSNLAKGVFEVHFLDMADQPHFFMGKSTTLSGSGTFTFPPSDVPVPAEYSHPGGWPKFTNEWQLKAQVWKKKADSADWQDYKLRAGQAFTLLVENPSRKPSLEIVRFEYVIPPDTVAVNESTQVKVHITYYHFDPSTKAELKLSDNTGVLASRVSRVIAGDGSYVYTMAIKAKRAGRWDVVAEVDTVSGSMPYGNRKSFWLQVIN